MLINKGVIFCMLYVATFSLAQQEENEDTSDYGSIFELLTAGEDHDGSAKESTLNTSSAVQNLSQNLQETPQPSSLLQLLLGGFKPTKMLSTHLEVLRIIEQFLQLKVELTARLYGLMYDNADLIRNVLRLVVGKLSKMQSFSLRGIKIIRQVLEFAVVAMQQWEMPQ